MFIQFKSQIIRTCRVLTIVRSINQLNQKCYQLHLFKAAWNSWMLIVYDLSASNYPKAAKISIKVNPGSITVIKAPNSLMSIK